MQQNICKANSMMQQPRNLSRKLIRKNGNSVRRISKDLPQSDDTRNRHVCIRVPPIENSDYIPCKPDSFCPGTVITQGEVVKTVFYLFI